MHGPSLLKLFFPADNTSENLRAGGNGRNLYETTHMKVRSHSTALMVISR